MSVAGAGRTCGSGRLGRSGSRAFSLFEAMLAVGLVAAISGGVFTFLFNLGVGRGGVERGAESLRGAAALLDGLEADVAGAIAVDSDGAGGVVGDETSLMMLTRGVAPPVLGGGMEVLASDLQGVEYRFDEGAGTLSARRWNVLAGEGRGGESVLATGVSRVRLRYYDGSGWRESFDSAANGLPVAIEVAVWFGGGGSDEDEVEAPAERDEAAEGFADELPEGEGEAGTSFPTPDRVRVILVPDGPVSGWEGAR